MPFVAQLHDHTLRVRIVARRPRLRLEIGGQEYQVEELPSGAMCEFSIMLDDRRIQGWRYITEDEAYVRVGGRTYVIAFPGSASGGRDGGSDMNEIRAEMPGTVVSIYCRAGDVVKTGDKLVMTESMKLQVVHTSPRDGTVESINCCENVAFDKGAILMTLTKVDECR
jgi:biotin carboxyl carrier protein